MQDLRDGTMVPIPKEILDSIPVVTHRDFTALMRCEEQAQRIKDATIPDRSRQGPIFAVGEELVVKGGNFKVVAITKHGLVLRGLPT